MKEFFPPSIGPFKRYDKRPNTITGGFLYTKTINLKLPHYSKRIIRVFLPKDYDDTKKYKLLIMSDGQNLFDRYTSAFGEWNIDLYISHLISKGKESFLVVGIDCPNDELFRIKEYMIHDLPIKKCLKKEINSKSFKEPYGSLLAEQIVRYILPLLKKHFSISSNKQDIGFGGSSMGGLFSFDIVNSYPDVFGFSLCFSPAFNLFRINDYLKTVSFYKNLGQKIYIYTGTLGYEKQFLKPCLNVVSLLGQKGFDVSFISSKKGEHNEASWHKQFLKAIQFGFNI